MSETFQSHELHSPCSQMLGNHHLCDTSRVTSVKRTGNDEGRSNKNYIKEKIDDVNVSNTSSLTSFSPFMSALELSPFLTSSESPLPTDYVWHEENIPRFNCIAPEFQDTWNLNKHAGIILTTDSEDDDNYNIIPQFDGTSDEMSSSHQKSNQNRIPPIVSQHTDCLQPSRGLPEHQSSRSNLEAQSPLGVSWNTGTAEGDMGTADIYSPGRRTQQEVSQTWPHQQQCQWLQQQPKMPTLLPSSPAASFQSPTHSSDASPPQLQPQSPAYKSILSNKAHQHPYQSPSQYPYQSPQSSWGFHSSHQPYNSPSASQSYQQLGESCEPCQSAPAGRTHQSPTRSEVQSADLLFESPCSSHQPSQSQLYQTTRDPSTYQSSSQSHEMFYSQKPHPCHTSRHDACGSTRSVWGSHTYPAQNQEQMDTQNLKSCQNSCVTLASCVVKNHLKVHYSSNDMQGMTPDSSFHQSDPHDRMFPQDCGEKPSVNHPFMQSSTGVAHMSVPELKSNATLHHSVTSMDRQPSINSSIANNAESSKVSTKKVGIFSSTPVSDQCSIAEPGQINRRNKQTAFIKKIIDSPTPPMPGRRYRNRVKQGVELLGRSRSTSLSSPGSPMMELYRCQPQANVNIPEVGQPGVSHPARHPFSCESRMPSPMHSSDWQCWKEQNFPPGCQWQEWKMPEWPNVDSCEHLSGGSVEPNIALMGSRFQHISCSVDNVVSCSNEHNLQQNKMPLFTDTQDAFENNWAQSLQAASPYGHTSASKVKTSEQSPSPNVHHLAPHADFDDALQVRTPASSVSMGCTSRRNLKDTAPVSVLPGHARKDPTQFRQESSSTPAEIPSCTDSDVFSDPKLESVSKSNSLGSIYFDGGKHGMKNYNLFETTSPSADTGDCGGESSPSYTIAFQVPPAGVKSVSYLSSAGSRTDSVKVLRMHPGDAESHKLLKIGCEMVKAVKLSEVDLEGYVEGELSTPGIIPSDGRAHHLGLETSAAGVDEHSVNDRERAILSTLNTDFLQYKAAGQNSLNTSQTNAPMTRASPTVNCLSSVHSEWTHQNADHSVENCQKEVGIGCVQCEDSQIESTSRAKRFKSITGRHELSQEHKDRHVDSQRYDSGSLLHQLNPKQDSCCVHSVPSSIEDVCHASQKAVCTSHASQKAVCTSHASQKAVCTSHASQKAVCTSHASQKAVCTSHASQKAVCTSHLPHQHHHHHQQQQQSRVDQAPCDELQHRAHSRCPHPGLHMELHATDQHWLASSLKSMTVSHNPCDDRQNNENTDNSSRCDIQANIACSSSHTAVQQHGTRCTLKQPEPGQQPSARPGNSCSQVHTEQSCSIDKTHASYTTRAGQLEHSENSSSSSSLAQLGCEEDSDEMAHCKLAENGVSEQPGQSSEFLSQYGEQRIKLSSRKNVKALCLTIPKPQSRMNSLDLDGMHTCSDKSEKNSTCSSQRELDSGESNYKDKCTFRRSRRCSRLEDVNFKAEEKHSPRKAKLQSAYSKSPHILKLKKTRKTAVSLIEGVHYVVVGKFKGDKMMLVKTTKLDVTPAKSVNVDEYEKITAKEIVRVVKPGTSHESRMCSEHSKPGTLHESRMCSDHSKPGTLHESRMCSGHSNTGNDPCDISEGHSDVCSHNPDSGCDNSNIDRALTRTQSIPEASLGASELSSVKDGFQPDRLRNRNESKNIFTTFTKEAGEWRTRLKEDNFFFKFKESFIKHCKGKEHIPDLQLKDQDNIFFEGVKRSSFCNFQQKFLSNIQKLKSGDYSSSSDDEDDILDETILKKRIGLSRRPLVSQVESRATPLRPLKLGFPVSDGSLGIGHSTIRDSVCSLSDQYNISKHYVSNPEKPENGQENKWAGNSRLGSYPATGGGLDAIDEGRHSEHQNKSAGWLHRVQQEVEADKDRHLLKDYDSEKYMCSTWDMENMNSSDEINMGQRNIYQQNYVENSILPNNTKDEETKEDYLKCQMAFFEDISSDSESNDTIIMDTCMGKTHTFQRGATTLYPSFSITDSCPDKPAERMYIPTQKSNLFTGSDKSKLQRLIEHNNPRCDTVEQPEVSRQREAHICAIGNEHGPLSETLGSKLTQASIPSVFTQVFKLSIQQKDTSVVDENNSSSSEDMVHSSQGAFVDQEQSLSASIGNSTAESKITHSSGSEIMSMPTEPRSSTESVLFTKAHNKKRRRRKAAKKMKQVQATKERQTMEDGNSSCHDEVDVSMEPDCQNKSRKKAYTYDEVDVSVEPDNQNRSLAERKKTYTYDEVDVSMEPDCQNKSLPERKKAYTYDEVDVSVEPDCQNRSLAERKKAYTYDEVDVSVEPDCQNRSLAERKKAYTYDEVDVSVEPDSQSRSLAERKKAYTYYAELLDSDDDVSSDSSDEDFTVCSSQRKALMVNRKSKGRNLEERPTRKLPKINIDSGRATKRGHKTSSSRGRKKKATGGDKLLNSLSILHMATLANLTEMPSDLPDHQSVSEAAKYGHTLYYTDNSLSSAPDEMFPYSSQHSQEEDPPTGSNKRWKHSRKRKCARENTTLSKKLLKRQTNLKYGHNVTSDTGRNPVSLSRLINNFSSSSPVPSNFTFNHSSEVSCQLEAANLCEYAGTNNTLQLLETRRAQVNCASFSMKDILKLTTPDDSMDSDSRDSSVLVRLSASKKAQVKSTALSMSDILKLTNVNSHGETEQIPAPGNMLTSLQPTADFPTSHSSVETEARVSFPSSQSSMEAVVTSCAGQREAADSVSTTSHTQTNSSELSGGVRSHLKQFNSDPHQLHITDTEYAKTELAQLADSQNPVPKQCAKDSSIEPVSCVPVEGRTSWVQVERKPRKKSMPGSDPVQVNTVEITCSPGSKVKALDTDCCLDGRNNKHENDSEFKTCVNRLEESHKRLEISSSDCASSPVLDSSPDVKSASETMPISSSLNSVVKEPKHTTSLSTFSHSPHSVLKTSVASKGHRDREQVDSENVVISQRMGLTTAGDSSQVTGPGSPSVSPIEEFDQLNYDAVPIVPSQIVLEASIPGTSMSPVVKTARLSGTSSRAFCNQKVSCSSSEPSSTFSKQENKGNHKSVNVRNTDRGIKPLHPLQIPHYSSVDQNIQPQVEHVPQNTKSSSLYYPHCWQWPVHTPGSDSTASPVNLCTSHKSPNNYSPITPTSPVSPDYPTQAQGVTEFDKSPRVTEGKPLWYPWLKVDSGRVETRVSNAQSSHYSNEEFKIHTLRNTRLLPVQQSEQEETAIVFREPAQVDPQKVRHDVKTTLDLPKQSPSKNKDQFNSTSTSGFVKPRGALLSTEPSPETAIVASSCVTGGESLPSTSCSETLAGAELKVPLEVSTVAALNTK